MPLGCWNNGHCKKAFLWAHILLLLSLGKELLGHKAGSHAFNHCASQGDITPDPQPSLLP